jgi:histone H1-like protein Hc1
VEKEMAEDNASGWDGSDRRASDDRRSDDRRKEDRRKMDLGPPPGLQERRLFDRRAQGTITGQLLVEVGRFASENMAFRQKGNKAAARRARKHLSQIMKLAKQRRAEISAEVKGMSASASGEDASEDDDDDSDD